MAEICLPPLLAASWLAQHAVSLVLLAGLALLTIGLAVLMWTRWGQARPLAKCAGLSLFAHLLLLIYLYTTRVLFDVPPGKAKGPVQVQLAQATALENEAPADAARAPAELKPWDEIAPAPPPTTPLPEPPRRELPDLLPAPDPPPPPPAPIAPEPPPPPPDPAPAPEAAVPPPAAEAVAPQSVTEPPPPPAPQEFVAGPAAPPRRFADGQPLPEALQARVSDRLAIAMQYGGSLETEQAVANALDWLVRHQSPDGRWRAADHGAGIETHTDRQNRGGAGRQADTGVTGLALLALLGAGNTHLEGKHRVAVQHGLEFLLLSQAADGNVRGDAELFAAMYCHGIATLALTEAYAMTGDERLKTGVERALGYTLRAQHAEGGWRYQPGDIGDLSQFGWQLMALKSGEHTGFAIPAAARTRMAFFLRSVSAGRSGGLARYRTVDPPTTTMTAEGLACRLFLSAENSPAALREGSAQVLRDLPRRDNVNYYYWYYATLALHQLQGDDWRRWNAALKEELLTTQRADGELAGSWDPDRYWGGYGGRVYSTALPALCLEVYYRYLPLLHSDPRFTELPGRGAR